MDIVISNSSPLPIYEQVQSQIKNAIVSGELKEGDGLPSIRTLAKDLRISVITTKRAYDELEKAGYIYTVAAKGCYVAQKNLSLIREENLTKIEEHMRSIIAIAPSCGLTQEKIIEMFRVIYEEK